MELKINQLQQINTEMAKGPAEAADGTFKFTLASQMEESELQARLTLMMEDIVQSGKSLGKRMDIREMKQQLMDAEVIGAGKKFLESL